ncbi:conserved hypothetical protein [Ricinus communis]|uniref:Uncharacterized protein n=1 Tax=Ricinus communis TaxID=3988 RepID=B9T212_RICCO|nr:conserved hypothetical protein [Ricinus communis]
MELSRVKLRFHSAHYVDPKICAGNFNVVVGINDKWGGSQVAMSQVNLFQDLMDKGNLVNLDYEGPLSPGTVEESVTIWFGKELTRQWPT